MQMMVTPKSTQRKLFKSVRSLKRESVSHSIMNIILDYILSRELKPGDKLPTEAEFVEQLGVGKGSVREAIKMLSSLGIIEIKRGVGTFIRNQISESALNPLILSLAFEHGASQELAELRIFIDTAVGQLAGQKIQDVDIARLEGVINSLRSVAENEPANTRAIRNLDLEFHGTLLAITGNPFVSKIGRAIYALFPSAMDKSIEQDPKGPAKGHGMILDALKTRDPETIRKTITTVYKGWPLG